MVEQEASVARKISQFFAVLIFTAFFIYQAYEIYTNKDKWASSFYSAYGSFESWWNKQFKRTMMKEFAYDMPDQSLLRPYKAKIALGMGYGCAFGSLLLWTGEKWAAAILLIPQFLYTAIINGPMHAKTQTTFGRPEQAWVLDCMIMTALIMITGSNLQIASANKKQQVDAKRAF